MRHFRRLISCVALFFLAGCFQATTVVRVNPDGSGTVEESMLLSSKFLAQLNEMMKGFSGDSGDTPKPLELFDPAKLKAQALAMGEGVTYRAGEKVMTADYSGYTATYAFTDINKLSLTQQGSDAAGAATGGGKPASMPIRFHLTKGSPATLTVEQLREKTAGNTTSAPQADTAAPPLPDEETRKLAEMFMGMKFMLAIEVNGAIVKTNATHRDGTRLTIVSLDVDKLDTAQPLMDKMNLLRGGSFVEARELLKEVPGVKVDMNDKLTVVFRK